MGGGSVDSHLTVLECSTSRMRQIYDASLVAGSFYRFTAPRRIRRHVRLTNLAAPA